MPFLDYSVFLENFMDLLKGIIYVLLSMCRHQREADEGVLGRNRRSYDRIDEKAYRLFCQQFLGNHKRLLVVADEQRDDRCRRIAYLAAHLAETVDGIMCQVPEMLDAFGL